MRKIFNLVVLSVVSMIAVGSANAAIIVADRFDMDHDWSGKTESDLKGITSTDQNGNAWGGIGANYPAVINEASRYGDAGRGLRFQLAPGSGKETIGCEMSGYPKAPWQGPSQFIGYYSKVSDNTNWGTKGSTLKMLRFNMEKNDVIPELVGGAYSVFIGTSNVFNGIYRPDNNWHKYLWEFTAQSSSAAADGVIRLWVDDAVVWEKTDVKWNSYGTIAHGTHFDYGYTTNWYFFFLQGNLSATYNGPEKFMYWDNYIIATTKAEVESFIGTPATAAAKAMTGGATVEDNLAPDDPTGLAATASSPKQVDISWGAAVDNVAVTGYKVYRNGTYVTTVTRTSMSDTGLNPSTDYSYTVSAIDATGNESQQSIPATATTEYAPVS
ncbi:fibronectin type III domain protein [Geotalea daltonii FRC-32]|uniref:Fibronectin type III domain protein n=1 Tax=Geotalea daltonii (strain DSM 22248 / JCM 15807 / FRC-32) TaxID=316067 RepID=B9M2W0_GEODF|nr:fibronectin type III domain-containing protein [Geotalea daltonii]ACM21306.1 fibronectin type III domain protein [Geotalea daltonii FRC-32]